MKRPVLRTCSEIKEHGANNVPESSSQPINEFRDEDAYVLLGAPGAGKTTTFMQEAAAIGGQYVTARNFLTFDNRPEWRGATLFIDGLDEMRAGLSDGRTPLDGIRNKLDKLGRPRFRLSCRQADWFGANDRQGLQTVSRGGRLKCLRLDPLSDQNIREILQMRPDVRDPGAFMETARSRGIDSLLVNPQSLGMLADAVADGDWPETRIRTFEMACRRLLGEHNHEHQAAIRASPDIRGLMDTAGRLCALQLLSGKTGYTLTVSPSVNDDYPGLEQIAGSSPEISRHVLRTKLFNSPSEGCAAPVHRQIAEFLAGRYLARLIDQGLAPGRVFALMTGHDGAVVSELRGLSAWLAAHSKPSRPEIIRRDPLGTVLYGDARQFSFPEKRLILRSLAREAERNSHIPTLFDRDVGLGAIATADMEGEIRSIIANPSRGDAREALIWVVIVSLDQAPPLPALADLLLEVVNDGRWRSSTRSLALDQYIRCRGSVGDAVEPLKALLENVRAARVPDPDDTLQLRLLEALYPKALPATELITYLPASERSPSVSLRLFWAQTVRERSNGAQSAELMDALADQLDDLVESYSRGASHNLYILDKIIPNTVVHVLEEAADEINPARLYDWLGAASHPRLTALGARQRSAKKIRDWLSKNAEVQKSLIQVGVRRSDGGLDALGIQRRLFDAKPPHDFRYWCLGRAQAAKDEHVVKFFLRTALEVDYGDKQSRDVVEQRVSRQPRLRRLYEGIQDAEVRGREKQRSILDSYSQRQREFEVREELKRQERYRAAKKQEAALRENRAPAGWLDALATAYLGGYSDVDGDNPKDRLRDLLGEDNDLIGSVLDGLSGCLERSDFPTDDEIIALHTKDKRHVLARPIIAGIEEMSYAKKAGSHELDERQMRAAIAVYYTEPHWPIYSDGAGQAERAGSRWFTLLLASHPHVVSDVLVKYASSRLRKGAESVGELYSLAHDAKHADVARLASLPLLHSFPVRCKEAQLSSLRLLLHAACRYCEKSSFVEMIARKLAFHSMNVGQRVYWLAAGLCVSPGAYLEKVESYTSGNERRITHLAQFAAGRYYKPARMFELLDAPALQLLIRLIAPSCRPSFSGSESHSVKFRRTTPAGEAAMRVLELIHRLAAFPSLEATEALERLSCDEALRAWRSQLCYAAAQQFALRREADFQHCTIKQAMKTLDNREPANVADLAALTADDLRGIAAKVRHGSTSDWRQYWNVDSYNRPLAPKPENACRDALLSDLQNELMRLHVDAQPEGQYANDKRADIRVSHSDYNVPIEVKKSCHANLWSAAGKQLITKYTPDPGADGHGIYLVFWFGDTEHCRPTPGANGAPKDAQELQQLLVDSLSTEQRRKTTICVVDVAKPTN